NHLLLDEINIMKLTMKIMKKNKIIVHTSCELIIFILLLRIFSIDIYIELLASKGAITPKHFY
ncbi:hypothetical protein, partial [Pseudomonas aeruginosa]|uniref:hypothetical protein n=1 Tax=Pseudomonas aeruginosa TaxID=287 RepID=UPI003F7EE21E